MTRSIVDFPNAQSMACYYRFVGANYVMMVCESVFALIATLSMVGCGANDTNETVLSGETEYSETVTESVKEEESDTDVTEPTIPNDVYIDLLTDTDLLDVAVSVLGEDNYDIDYQWYVRISICSDLSKFNVLYTYFIDALNAEFDAEYYATQYPEDAAFCAEYELDIVKYYAFYGVFTCEESANLYRQE